MTIKRILREYWEKMPLPEGGKSLGMLAA